MTQWNSHWLIGKRVTLELKDPNRKTVQELTPSYYYPYDVIISGKIVRRFDGTNSERWVYLITLDEPLHYPDDPSIPAIVAWPGQDDQIAKDLKSKGRTPAVLGRPIERTGVLEALDASNVHKRFTSFGIGFISLIGAQARAA